MTDDQGPVLFVNGPLGSNKLTDVPAVFRKRGKIAIPVNEAMEITETEPFAFIIYEKSGIPGQFDIYHFRGFKKVDDSPFMVRFADGPLAGERRFRQPIQGLPWIVMVPLPSEPFDGDGRLRVFALYEKRLVDGIEQLCYVETQRRVVKSNRVLVEYIGGPLDGTNYDSDTSESDFGSMPTSAYLLTERGTVGKRFMTASPHALAALHEFGELAMKYGGPFTFHKYEVIDKLEEPYEVYIRVKHVPTESIEET
jgi:hypothetical protein